MPEWAVKAYEDGMLHYGDDISTSPYELFLNTLEGTLHVDVGDFVIKGVNGELYPCKPDIFKKMYDVIEK